MTDSTVVLETEAYDYMYTPTGNGNSLNSAFTAL